MSSDDRNEAAVAKDGGDPTTPPAPAGDR